MGAFCFFSLNKCGCRLFACPGDNGPLPGHRHDLGLADCETHSLGDSGWFQL